jgi:hypothetical protein
MAVQAQIEEFLAGHQEPKKSELAALHELITQASPGCKLWFSDGLDEAGKPIANPTIGYGEQTIRYAKGTSREFFRIGLSATKSGISVFIMGLADKKFIPDTFSATIGKAKVTGYCISFKKLADIDPKVLRAAVSHGFAQA